MQTDTQNLPALPDAGSGTTDRGTLEVSAASAKLDARNLRIGETLVVDEVRLTGNGITFSAGGGVRVAELNATIVVTESALNSFLAGRAEDSLHDLKVFMLTGKVRIEGRYGLIPFAYTGAPEIEGGARLRIDPKQLSLLGLPMPGVGVHMIGEKLNAQLARAFDITRFAVPMRITALTIETGRLLLSGTASVELAPGGPPSESSS
jgi:hypothetical protein